MIEASGLSKRFGSFVLFDGIDVNIARGRITAIVGPNGAGKTTFIKMLLGLVHPDRGEILFDGETIAHDVAYRARIGYMPQGARFPDHLTAQELLAMVKDLRRADDATHPVDEELVEAFGLAGELDKQLRVLSGGTRQKVSAALAFLYRPDLLILDEPTAGLDPLSASVLKDKILADRGGGVTFIVASHLMNELEELADDIVLLIAGRVRYAGPVYELLRLTRADRLERAVAQLMLLEAAA